MSAMAWRWRIKALVSAVGSAAACPHISASPRRMNAVKSTPSGSATIMIRNRRWIERGLGRPDVDRYRRLVRHEADRGKITGSDGNQIVRVSCEPALNLRPI